MSNPKINISHLSTVDLAKVFDPMAKPAKLSAAVFGSFKDIFPEVLRRHLNEAAKQDSDLGLTIGELNNEFQSVFHDSWSVKGIFPEKFQDICIADADVLQNLNKLVGLVAGRCFFETTNSYLGFDVKDYSNKDEMGVFHFKMNAARKCTNNADFLNILIHDAISLEEQEKLAGLMANGELDFRENIKLSFKETFREMDEYTIIQGKDIEDTLALRLDVNSGDLLGEEYSNKLAVSLTDLLLSDIVYEHQPKFAEFLKNAQSFAEKALSKEQEDRRR